MKMTKRIRSWQSCILMKMTKRIRSWQNCILKQMAKMIRFMAEPYSDEQ